MSHAQDFELLLRQADAAEHHAVAAQRLDGVDAHAAHHFLDLVLPCRDEIHQPLRADVGIQPLDKLRIAAWRCPSCTVPLWQRAAKMAAQREQRGGADVAGVRAESDGLDHVGATSGCCRPR